MASELPIRLATAADLDAFTAHVVRHVRESGVGGAPIFTPARHLDGTEVRASAAARWARALDEPLWGRCFVLLDGGEIVGHAELRGGRIPAEMHRAGLGMGIERPHTGHGQGRRLLDACLDWARRVAELEHVDLGVFAGNEPAQRLYRRAGFVDVGVRREAFRLEDGRAVDDILMTLDLRAAGRGRRG